MISMRVTNSATKIKKRLVTSLSLNYFTKLSFMFYIRAFAEIFVRLSLITIYNSSEVYSSQT